MKTQNKNNLVFSKENITELNDVQSQEVKGGTSFISIRNTFITIHQFPTF